MGDGRLTELRVAERDAERAIERFEPLFDGRLAHAGLLDLDRLTACVVPAVRANAVRCRLLHCGHALCAALSAPRRGASRSASCSASSWGRAMLWCLPCRPSRLGRSGKRSASAGEPLIQESTVARALPEVRLPPHVAQSPWQSEQQRGETARPKLRIICSGSSSPSGPSGWASLSRRDRARGSSRSRWNGCSNSARGSGGIGGSIDLRHGPKRGCPPPPTPAAVWRGFETSSRAPPAPSPRSSTVRTTRCSARRAGVTDQIANVDRVRVATSPLHPSSACSSYSSVSGRCSAVARAPDRRRCRARAGARAHLHLVQGLRHAPSRPTACLRGTCGARILRTARASRRRSCLGLATHRVGPTLRASRKRWASASARRATSSLSAIRRCSSCACSTMRSPSARALPSSSSRSFTNSSEPA